MPGPVAIVGVGCTPARSITPDVSYREMITEAAVRAYQDAGIHPQEVQSFVCCEEDFHEGISISDEYTPDQLGAVQKPVHTVGGDGLHALADACMQILTGLVDLVVVESHSKASNILTPHHITNYALDPVLNRPLGVNPHYIAGLEMTAWMAATGTTLDQVSRVITKNKRNALRNPYAAHPAALAPEDLKYAAPLATPMTSLHVAPTADAAFVLVLASEERAGSMKGRPVWIKGVGWSNDTPTLESRDWSRAACCEQAAERAYRMAGIAVPSKEIDVFEVDDTYAYKELQHLEALQVFGAGEAGKATERGLTGITGSHPVNPSGGALGMGHMLDATGLARAVQICLQMRGRAGEHQIPGARTGLAMSWRGVPTTSGAVVILSAD